MEVDHGAVGVEVEVFVERPQECAQLFFRLERRGEAALAVYGAVCYNVKNRFFRVRSYFAKFARRVMTHSMRRMPYEQQAE